MTEPTVRELLARLEAQQARIEQLEALAAPASLDPASTPAPAASEPEADPAPSRMTRRGMLKSAAVGTAVIGAVLAEPELANASGSDPATFTSSSGEAAVKATNKGKGNAVQAIAGQGTTLHASQNSRDASAVAVRGTIDDKKGRGTGVVGAATLGVGVEGSSVEGIGVYGTTKAKGLPAVAGSSDHGVGVLGLTEDGAALFGQAKGGIAVDGQAGTGVAVSGTSDGGYGVHGTSTSSQGVRGESGSDSGVFGISTSQDGVYGKTSANTYSGVVGETTNNSLNYGVFSLGNFGATGTKAAVVPAADGGDHLTLYCVESPECWFEDFGSGVLSAGSTTVTIDPVFAQTIHTATYHVFLQAEGDCAGLSVERKTATSFGVRELAGGTTDVPFAYRIVALRKGVTAPRLHRVKPFRGAAD